MQPFYNALVKLLLVFYNTSARHEQHEWDTSDTSATRVRREFCKTRQHAY